MRYILATALAASIGATAAHAVPGKVVVFGDEWILSNTAFSANNGPTTAFAGNLANFLGGTDYLFATNNLAFGSSLETLFESVPFNRTVTSTTATLTPALIGAYDAVFLAGATWSGAANAPTINNYVAAGGSVVIALGTGVFGGPAGEVAAWNDVMSAWGLGADGAWDGQGLATRSLVDGPGTLDDGVASLYWGNGHTVTQDAGNPNSSIAATMTFSSLGDRAVIGVYDGSGTAVVPVPAALPLLASALGMIGLIARRRRG